MIQTHLRRRLRLPLIGVFLFLFFYVSLFAQKVTTINGNPVTYISTNKRFFQAQVKINTLNLLRSPQYKQAVREVKRKKAQSKATRLPFAKMSQHKVGDIQKFYTRNILDQTKWNTLYAKLIYDTVSFAVWIDTTDCQALLDSTDVSAIVDSLGKYALHETPPHSVNPSKGILEIMTQYFGSPPNYDGDNKTEILLLDIKDRFSATGSYVAGFFDPNDLTENDYSNKRDLLYIDIYPTIKYEEKLYIENAVSTFTHELQHLIHIHYENEAYLQFVFINEGLSEYAEILCGFKPRSAENYFQNSNRSFLSWNYENPLPDYSRASLWTHYLFEQIGSEHIKKLVQSPKIGLSAIKELLHKSGSSYSFQQIFHNWHLANILNNTMENEAYGYRYPLRKNIKMHSSFVYDLLPLTVDIPLPKMSVRFIEFPLTKALAAQSIHKNISGDIIMNYPNGIKKRLLDYPFNGDAILANDFEYGSILLLLKENSEFNSEISDSSQTKILLNGKKSAQIMELKYDDGFSDIFHNNASFLLLNGYEQKIALVFPVDLVQNIWLYSFSLKTIFLNEISDSHFSIYEPRDLSAHIAVFSDGKPAAPLTEPKTFTFNRPLGNLKFETFSLLEDYQHISSLNDSFCIVIQNDKDDSNFVALGMDSSSLSHTYLFSEFDGQPEWRITDDIAIGADSLTKFNAMVRANIAVKPQLAPHFSYHFTHSFTQVQLNIELPFAIDTNFTTSAVVLPNGNYATPSRNFSSHSVRFAVDLQIGASYQFFTHIQSQDNRQIIDTVLTYQPPFTAHFTVGNNYPNPFNSETQIPFVNLKGGKINYIIYNILGQKISSNETPYFEVGQHRLNLKMNNKAAGIYFVVMKMDASPQNPIVKKVILLK
jgi:hypothetical protein